MSCINLQKTVLLGFNINSVYTDATTTQGCHRKMPIRLNNSLIILGSFVNSVYTVYVKDLSIVFITQRRPHRSTSCQNRQPE